MAIAQLCTAICKDGTSCRNWAAEGSELPRCGTHGAGGKRAGPVAQALDEPGTEWGVDL